MMTGSRVVEDRAPRGSGRGLRRAVRPLGLILALLAGAAPPAAPAPPLTRVVDVRLLGQDGATNQPQVRLEGVLTFVDGPWNIAFLQDDTGGVFLAGQDIAWRGQAGQRIRLEGRAAPGGYAPIVEITTLELGGTGPLPEPRRPLWEALATGRADSDWVELRGVVQHGWLDDGHFKLVLHTRGTDMEAIFAAGPEPPEAAGWIGAEVRVQAVASTTYTADAQFITTRLLIPGAAFVRVLQPTPADPWSAPGRTPGRLLGFHPETPHHSRVRVRGTVTYADATGLVFLQQGDEGLRLEVRSGPLPRPGDTVEALGFPRAGDYGPTLRYSVVRPAADPGPPPVPSHWSAMDGEYHARLVQVEARVREQVSRPDGWNWILENEALGMFEARLPRSPDTASFRPAPAGADVRLTGVAEARSDDQRVVSRMTLHLRHPADVLVTAMPGFWTRARMQQLAGVLGFALFLAGTWGSYLRRRVQAQADQLVEQINRERALEHRFHELVEHASDLIFITDAQGTLERWNRATAALLAIQEGETGGNLLRLATPEDRPRLQQAFQRAADGEASGTLLFTTTVRSEHRVVLEATARRVVNEHQVPRIEWVARDITARHRAEAALRASEARLQATVQNTPHVCIQWFDAQGRVRFWNHASEAIYGYSAAEAEGRRLGELIFDSDQEREFDALLAGLAADGRPRGPMLFKFRTHDGRRGVCLSTVFAIPGPGKESWFVCMDVDLTERRTAERALEASESRFRALSEHSPVGIYQQDPEGRCLYVNQRWQEITGFTRAQALGQGWLRAIHPEDLPAAEVAWQEAAAAGREFRHTLRIIRPDGEIRQVAIVAGALCAADGGLQGYVGTLNDITESHATELRLRESEERFRALFEHSPDAIFVESLEGEVLQANPAAGRLHGMAPEKLTGRRIEDLVPAAHRGTVREAFRRLASEGVETLESWSLTADDRAVPVEIRARTLRWREAPAVLLHVRDISERHRSALALAASEQRHRSTIAVLAEGVLLVGPDALILAANDSAARILGLPAGALPGRSAVQGDWSTCHADGTPFIPEDYPVSVTLRTGQPQNDVVMGVRRPDGELRWLSINTRPLTGPEGAGGVVVSFADITQRRAVEEALQEAHASLERRVADRTRELEAANARLSEFAHVITHDLRAPLRGITQLAGWIAQDHAERLDEPGRHLLRLIGERATLMIQLLEGVLAYSRLGEALSPQPVSLALLLPRVVALLDPPARFSVTWPDSLPTLTGVPEQLHQIFQNLLDNALKHHDRPEGRIEISTRRHPAGWEIRVADDGPGIPPRYHEKIFQIFQQLNPRTPGTGLGLALVRRIVVARGGRIWVESGKDRGTTFAFTWPDQPLTPADGPA